MPMRPIGILIFFLLTLAWVLSAATGDRSLYLSVDATQCFTNVAQLKNLSGSDGLDRSEIHLTGTITLVDSNRALVVLQDSTGAVALHSAWNFSELRVGQIATINGTNCHPFFSAFPDFPLRSASCDIQPAFETPLNWGEYNLTRMRGFLHPAVTGDYKFWIASDNSSELWLSTDSSSSNVRKIASVQHFAWTEPRQWSKYPSQASGSIRLKAGATYYIEALQEQTASGENLSVGWQGPGINDIAIIDGQYLTPWAESSLAINSLTNGILREYWTNFFVGDVEGLAGPRPYESAITIKDVSTIDHGTGSLPQPFLIKWNQPLDADKNYPWVSVKGIVKFVATEGDTAALEIYDGQNSIQVRAQHWSAEQTKALRQMTNQVIQVEGVCEAVKNSQGNLMPICIWATATNSITFLATSAANEFPATTNQSEIASQDGSATLPGYYGTRGVVTFNARVFDEDYIFMQENSLALRVTPGNSAMKNQFKVGQAVDAGGSFELGKSPPTLTPFFVSELGIHSMPPHIAFSTDTTPLANQEGRWSELDGVVRSANGDGTLTVATRNGLSYFWLGEKPRHPLTDFVDSRLRARGVLMLSLTNYPMLLVPSGNYLNVAEEPSQDPFGLTPKSIRNLLDDTNNIWSSHRVRLRGEITWQDERSFYLQDSSGGIRVQASDSIAGRVGNKLDVVGFLDQVGTTRILTDALVRPDTSILGVSSSALNLSDSFAAKQNGNLVYVTATLLAQKTNGHMQVLELQEQQRIFTATLPVSFGQISKLLPGSQLKIIGVYEDEAVILPIGENKSANVPLLAAPRILLRSPGDVVLLNGPPWWTKKKTAMLVVSLLGILAITSLWIYLLQQRLVRQRAARLAFSQLVFGKLEEERKRIAVNLHDSLGQSLLVIKNYAALANQSSAESPGAKNHLSEISDTTSQAIEEVRRITRGLRPYQLDRLGLTQAIRTLVSQSAENTSVSFACKIEDMDGLLGKDSEIHVYRIIQEAVNNVVKHSGATEGTVVIKKRAAVISLSIRDNGKGFDPAQLTARPLEHGFGLTGISERVHILKGSMTMDTQPGSGTSLAIEIPVSV